MWSVLAWSVVVAHLTYLLFQMCGGLLVLRDGRWLIAHLGAVAWGVGIVAVQGRCPVTLLEKALWARAGVEPYSGSFLDHYVFGRWFPDGSQTWVYAGHLAVIVLVYAVVVRRARRTGAGRRVQPTRVEQPR